MFEECTIEKAAAKPYSTLPWKAFAAGKVHGLSTPFTHCPRLSMICCSIKVVVFSEGEGDVLGYLSAVKQPTSKAVARKLTQTICQPMGGEPRRPSHMEVMASVPIDTEAMASLGITVEVSESLEVPPWIKEEMSVVEMMAEGETDPGLFEDPSVDAALLRRVFTCIAATHRAKLWSSLRISQLVELSVPSECTGILPPLFRYAQVQTEGQGILFYSSLRDFHAVSARRQGGLGKVRGNLRVS